MVSNCAFSTGREATLASLNRVVGDEDQPPDRQARRAGPRRIGGHARASHPTATGVCDLVDVDDAGHGGVAVSEEA